MDCGRPRRNAIEPRWRTAFQARWECLPDMEGPGDRRGKPPKIPPPPGPTAQETALQQEQIELIRSQRTELDRMRREQEQLAPLFYESAGIEAVRDEAGNITSFKRREDPLRAEEEEILGLQLKRSRAALAGELPVDPALLRGLEEEETELRDFLRQRFGPDYETASPAIEALAEHRQRKNEVLDAARRGDMSLAEGLSMARGGQLEQGTNLFFGRAGGTAQRQAPFISGAGTVAGEYAGPLSFMRSERLLPWEVNAQNSLSRANFQNQLIGTGISVGLGALGGGIAGASLPGVGAGMGALVGATGGMGTLPFLSMRRGSSPYYVGTNGRR